MRSLAGRGGLRFGAYARSAPPHYAQRLRSVHHGLTLNPS